MKCVCVGLGAVWEVSGYEDWVWALLILWTQGGVMDVCLGCGGVGGVGSGPVQGMVGVWASSWKAVMSGFFG